MLDHMFLAELVELAERSRKAAGFDPSFASDDELCQATVELEAARAAVEAAELHVLGELDARGTCEREFGLTTAAWLAERAHVARPGAVARVKVASKLRTSLPDVDAALSDGLISPDHARALADAANPRIADSVADHQVDLVAAAQQAPFAIWRRMLAELTELWDQDGGHDPAQDLARNRLHLDRISDTVA